MLIDCFFLWLSWWASIFVFTYLFINTNLLSDELNQDVLFMIGFCALFFVSSGVYRSMWRYPGIGTILRLVFATGLSCFSVYVLLRIKMGYWSNPGIGMMAFYFFLTLTAGVRLYPRVAREVRLFFLRISGKLDVPAQKTLRTLVVGAGESASLFLLNMNRHSAWRRREIMGILDSDSNKHGYMLHGFKILGDIRLIPELCGRLDIREIIIAIPSLSNDALREILRIVPVSQCKVRILKPVDNQKVSLIDNLRDLNISDLLGRPEADLDNEGISRWLKGRTVLVTGGGGSIGAELCRQLAAFAPAQIIIYDISENNAHNLIQELTIRYGETAQPSYLARVGSIQDTQRLNAVFEEFHPSVVFHAAAYKHVPLMEQCPELAVRNNIFGTYQTALASIKYGAERFVMISTDKAVNPTNVMGASKRLAELVVQSLNKLKKTEFVCVRFGNVLDSNGSVVPLFRRQIEAGGPVTVTHPDVVRYFMTIPEAARLVIQVGAISGKDEIYILDMGSPIKIAELAENLIRMAGLTPGLDVEIVYTGLRPGEKLYEELLLNDEGASKTQNNKIFVAQPSPVDSELANWIVSSMEHCLDSGGDIRAALSRMLPEYRPEHQNEGGLMTHVQSENPAKNQDQRGLDRTHAIS
jgi:FlaA1/EpsC-like NDP-sugar epimerase